MKLEDYGKFYHIDISTQIDNKWKEDSVLGVVKESRKFSIKIRGRDKEKIKKRFISDENTRAGKKHNRKIVAVIYSYILYKLLINFQEANPLLLCRDVRPERLVIHYLARICNYFNNEEVLNREIKFRKRIEFETQEKLPKSLAGKYTRKVYQGKIIPSKILDNSEVEELINLVSKIV